MNKQAYDSFYPVSSSMAGGSMMWPIGMMGKLREHLNNAKAGDREAESKLINRLGQLRRNVDHLDNLPDFLIEAVKESCAWLRTVGRVVDFKNPNPGMWITARDGKTPRF